MDDCARFPKCTSSPWYQKDWKWWAEFSLTEEERAALVQSPTKPDTTTATGDGKGVAEEIEIGDDETDVDVDDLVQGMRALYSS